MGMLTVTMLVKPTVVTTHLFFGMLTALILFMNGLKYMNFTLSSHRPPKTILLLISITWFILILQILLGGWTSFNYVFSMYRFPKMSWSIVSK